MATTLELSPSDALLWLEFGGIYTDSAGNRVVDNLATRGDAPARVTCGAGAACPTQLSGRRGVSFDGGDYIDCGLVDRFERTDKFTLFSVTSNATFGDIMCTYDQAQTYKGYGYQLATAESLNTYVINTTAGNWISKSSVLSGRSVTSVAIVNNGLSTAASVDVYINGRLSSSTTVQDSLSDTIKNGKPLLLGARHNGAAKTIFLIGNMHFTSVMPLAASQLQIQNLHKRVMRRINLP